MDFKDIAYTRRSINFFNPDTKVSPETLDGVIELASLTPSSFNLQPWNLIVLKEKAEREKLKNLAWDQPKIVEAPVVFIVLGDKNGWKVEHPTVEKNWHEMLNTGKMKPEQRDWFNNATSSLYGKDNDASLAFATKNAGFFGMSIMYAASELGLESHPMDGFDHEGVREAFNIPENFWIPLLIAIGYPKDDLRLDPPKWRKSKDEIVVKFT